MSLTKGLETLASVCNALEAINFQSGSSFPKELEAAFQKVFDFAQQHDQEFGKPNGPKEALVKHTKIKLFLEDHIGPIIQNIIKQHTGTTVEKFVVLIPTNPSALLTCVISRYINNNKQFFEVLNNQRQATDPLSDSAIRMANNMSKELDKAKGLIRSKIPLKSVIVLSVDLFAIQDFFKSDIVITAKELTAIILHEIGHVFVSYEYSADIAFFGYFGNNILRNATTELKQRPAQTINEVTNFAKKQLNKIDDSTLKTTLTKLLAATDVISEILQLDVSKKLDDETLNAYSTDMPSFWDQLLSGLIGAIISLVMFPMSLLFFNLTKELDYLEDVEARQSRDKVTSKNQTFEERYADEYVSRYGMSKEINSGLIKLHKLTDLLIANHSISAPLLSSLIKRNRVLETIISIVKSPNTMLLYIMSAKFVKPMVYEEISTRLKRNINNTVDVLKDLSLPLEIRTQLLADVDDMEKQLLENQNLGKIRVISKILPYLVNIPSRSIDNIRAVFGTQNTRNEYAELFEYLDNMLSNKSFYYAAKFKSLLK